MGEAAQLIAAIAALILVVGGFVVIYKPPPALRKLIFKDFSAEFDPPALAISDNTPPTLIAEELSPSVGEAGDALDTVNDTEAHRLIAPAESISRFGQAYGLLSSGRYREGMELISAEAASEKDAASQVSLLAFGQYVAYINGSTEALADLRLTASRNPRVSSVHEWFGRALSHAEEREQALAEFQIARDVAAGDEERARATIAYAQELKRVERTEEALEALTSTLRQMEDLAARSSICVALAEHYETSVPPDPHKAFGYYELALRLEPLKDSLRFDVAYKYLQQGAWALSLIHNEQLLLREPENDAAHNNAGVASEHLRLALRQVDHYRRAGELGSSLALANLASRLIRAGLREDAKTLLYRAQEYAEVHRRVYLVMEELAEAEEREQERHSSIAEQANEFRHWHAKYVEATISPVGDRMALSGVYQGAPSVVRLDVKEDGSVAGFFTYLEDKPASFSGRVEGSAIILSWRLLPKETDTPLLLLLGGKSGRGLLLVEGSQLKGFSVEGDDTLSPGPGRQVVSWKLERSTQIPLFQPIRKLPASE